MNRATLMNRQIVLASLAGCLLAVGCGPGPQARYTWRETTQELIAPAQQAVVDAVDQGFGHPTKLVAWEKLPLQYNLAEGTLAAVPDKAGVWLASWAGGTTPPLVSTGDEVFLVTLKGASALAGSGTVASGAASQGACRVKRFDAATSQIEFEGASAGEIADGDKFVLGFGEVLRLGRASYLKNCQHCHGTTGDGNGPTARFLNPRPRDYRLGIFKFTSTQSTERATRDDLTRVIKYGIPGTYMPSFLLVKDEETFALVEYVRWLSMRGEYEKRLADELADYNQPAIEKEARDDQLSYAEELAAGGKDLTKPPTAEEAIAKMKTEFQEFASGDWPDIRTETVEFITESWLRAEDVESREAVLITPTVPRVADTTESRERGRVLYSSDKTKCYTCHGPTGRGDGTSAEEFAKLPGSNDYYAQRGLHDTWGNPVPPRDLTRGQYRGGRRPIDLFCRISAGIKGTPMPAFGGTVLTDSDIWDVVNYVMSLQFQESLPETKTMTAEGAVPAPAKTDAAVVSQAMPDQPESPGVLQQSEVQQAAIQKGAVQKDAVEQTADQSVVQTGATN